MKKEILLGLAKSAILSQFDEKISIDEEKLLKSYPYLKEDGAVFVTLNQNNDLRGCIGSLVAHRKLFDDIVHNSISAAFHDPRFKSLCEDDLESLRIEISLLSPYKELEYKDYEDLKQKIIPFEDGLILKHESFQGTFLPQVWEQLPTPDLFLQHLSQKAGASQDIYKQHPKIYRYKVEKIGEEFGEILPL